VKPPVVQALPAQGPRRGVYIPRNRVGFSTAHRAGARAHGRIRALRQSSYWCSTTAMSEVCASKTLVAAVRAAAQEPERGFTFVRSDRSERRMSFRELYECASRRASALKRAGLAKGDRLAIIVIEAEDFIPTFFGAVLAGIVPVPLYPPFRPDMVQYAATARHIISTARARALVLDPLLRGRLRFDFVETTLGSDGLEDAGPRPDVEERVSLGDTAFIQFTSGSTSFPKGVVLTHANIATNVGCFMHEGLKLRDDDIGVTWLPLYHDMGLIGHVFGPVYCRLPMVFLSPFVFIRRPREWLRLISEHRATISFAPNFAYGLCTARVRDLDGLDLSTWRVAGCGSEPISFSTLGDFARRFGAAGFDRKALLAAYGMAESTLAVSFSGLGDGVSALHVDPTALHENGEVVETGGEDGLAVVGCGGAFPGHQVRIVDEKGAELRERRVGEIVVRGPSVMQGYFQNDEATRATVRDGWLHSGDLGFVADGQLYVCGRKKDLIIIAGRNYYPQDIEWAASAVEGVRTGNVVAFGLAEGDTESVVVVAETRAPRARWDQIVASIRTGVQQRVGIRPDRVVMVPPGTLPKTSSGKLQRSRTRERYVSGELFARPSLPRRLARAIARLFVPVRV
jgi:fatty-acyl-CoA synthase